VFVDGFLTHPKAFEVQVPTVPLGRLYGEELQAWFEKHQVEVLLDARARSLMVENDRVTGVVLRDGTVLTADWYVSAVPWDALAGLLSAELTAAHPAFSGLSHLEASPITSVHAWYDRPVLGALPHAVLVDCLGQWVFDRGPGAEGEHYVQVVVSAARPLRGLGRDEIARQITEELASLFPAAKSARLQRSKVVTEHAATFSAVPGVDRWRPPQDAPLANLALAGDWTDTGWPATMEGAVRSGYRAAEVLLARSGRPLTLVQPDLGRPRGNRR
jgi:squalene-associated FAD-dependent desaturase